MPSPYEYYKIEEKEHKPEPNNCGSDEDVSQFFYIGKYSHEKCTLQAVGCNGMIELCQITDLGGKD